MILNSLALRFSPFTIILIFGIICQGGQLEQFQKCSDVVAKAAITKKINQVEGTKLKTKWMTHYYSSKLTCNGKKIIFYYGGDRNISVPEGLELGLPCGSAGCLSFVFSYSKQDYSDLQIVFKDHVFDFLPSKNRNCPNILVVLHGSKFNRAGRDHGIGALEYKAGTYHLKRHNQLVVETSSNK